jgi:hypothetical protein
LRADADPGDNPALQPAPSAHLDWIVIADPVRTGGDILLVNLTSLAEDCVDDACILEPEDFVLLTHQTTVAYSRSQAGTTEKLQELIEQGVFTEVTAIPPGTLRRILQGALDSRELSAAKKRLVG